MRIRFRSRAGRAAVAGRAAPLAAALFSAFLCAAPAAAQAAPPASAPAAPAPAAGADAPAKVDRFAKVFDRSGDQGRLVARFIKMSLVTAAEEKSGDSTILSLPDGRIILVDAGAPECAAQVIACLDAMGVTRIDAFIASHPHVDHIGGLPAILARFPVGKIYMSALDYPTATYRGAVADIGRRGIPLARLAEGDAVDLGAGVSMKVYNPERDLAYYEGYPANGTLFVNDRSLVFKLSFGAGSMLFMGDVYTPRERELAERHGAELSAGLVKVGHHGADTSSGKAFARLVAPKVAVMMHDNLASLQVYRNWRKAGAATYATAVDGCVMAAVDGSGAWEVLTQQDRVGGFLD